MAVSELLYGWTNKTQTKRIEEKLSRNYIRMARACFEQILESTLFKTSAVWPLTSLLSNHLRKSIKTCEALVEE